MSGMCQGEISDDKWPYSYRASQYQNGMWTITVTRYTRRRPDESETRTYTSPRVPPTPAAAWHEAGKLIGNPAEAAASAAMRDSLIFERRELAEILHHLTDTGAPGSSGVLLLGAAATGKTILLRLAEEELERRGRDVFFISFSGLRDPGELGSLALDAVAASPSVDARVMRRTVRSSSGAAPFHEAAVILNDVGSHLRSPVLLFDALDESAYPQRMTAAIEELSLALDGWKLAVSSRPEAAAEFRHFARFAVVQLGSFSEDDAAALIRAYRPGVSEAVIPRIVELAGGNPFLLQIMARELQDPGRLAEITGPASLEGVLELLVNQAVSRSADPVKLSGLLEDLALAGGRERIAALASKSRITEEEARRLLGSAGVPVFLVLDDAAGTAAFFHAAISNVILSQTILAPEFRLGDLEFGAEEAERDGLLDESFVPRPGMQAIVGQRRSIIVGDRGSGKSAIFRKLARSAPAADSRPRVEIFPVTEVFSATFR
jgi:hypothetical protein